MKKLQGENEKNHEIAQDSHRREKMKDMNYSNTMKVLVHKKELP